MEHDFSGRPRGKFRGMTVNETLIALLSFIYTGRDI